MQDESDRDPLLVAVDELRRGVDGLRLPLDVAGVSDARDVRQQLVEQLDDYVLPRLRALDAPLLAVVGGSTGAGKSTLVNSVVGAPLSASGVLRPTTRSPVLVHHPDDAAAFADPRVLPSLRRVTGDAGSVDSVDAAGADGAAITAVRLAASDALPAGLALLDAPDIDSVVTANRVLAAQLMAAADLWIFVTTAARYADAVPWDLLLDASERGASVAIVLDRVPPEAMNEVRLHLAQMLRERGLKSSPLFTIAESAVDDAGLLDPEVVRPVRSWLVALAKDAQARQVVVRRTLNGILQTLPLRIEALTAAAEDQDAARKALAHAAAEAYGEAREAIVDGLSDGSMLRGEVLARWQEFVGTGEMLRSLEARVGRIRDRVVAAVKGRPAPEVDLEVALQTGVESLVTGEAELAAANAWQRWRHLDGGAVLVAAHPELDSASADLHERTARATRDWQGFVLELVGSEGSDRRTTARMLSYGVNGLGVLLMLVVFSHTAGLSGAEVGIAGGTALLAQRLLEAVFGDQAVRGLAAQARADLLTRCDILLADERARYDLALSEVEPGPGADDLRKALANVEGAR
ncbi:dynamin family protein [Angustibacter luteus]|uniref:Dynamin family protein n=1 Tax=Angustibacter luteus TaxID=658456 RepID=A0ABW1JJF4_9ACTN